MILLNLIKCRKVTIVQQLAEVLGFVRELTRSYGTATEKPTK
jgi:hypothetical protein